MKRRIIVVADSRRNDGRVEFKIKRDDGTEQWITENKVATLILRHGVIFERRGELIERLRVILKGTG